MKYHLGCGETYLDGYCNVDFPPENRTAQKQTRVDLEADLLVMPYGPCEEIRSSHVFEHFNEAALLEWWRGQLAEALK